ncbi:putative holin-like toxin [Phascolarctobacterium sp.]
MCRLSRRGGGSVNIYEAFSLMIAFGILVATIILACK